jgi:hypothetical protein
MKRHLFVTALTVGLLAGVPTAARAQAGDACARLVPDVRVRLSVPDRSWSQVVATVVSCSESELVVSRMPDRDVRLGWPAVRRIEVGHRRDLRWPLFAAGAGLGLWLGSQLPTENEEDCDYDYVNNMYDCFDRGTAMFLGLTIGAVPGYFGGMLMKFDRWELVPLVGTRSGMLARVTF